LVRPDAQVRPNQLRIPGETDVSRVGLADTGAHVGDRVVELVLEQEGDVILERVDGEAVAIAQPVEFEHLLGDRGERH
jgi:hypothetical protein